MKKNTTILIATAFFLLFGLSVPTLAYSSLAEDFIKSCYTLDTSFPPENWDKLDLSDAANEVLDGIENGTIEQPLTNFCLIALGHAGYIDDLPRVISHYDDLPITVLRALGGFPHPDAITFLIDKTGSKEIPTREVAVRSLSKIDFKKLDKPMHWFTIVKSKLIVLRDKEKIDWLKADIDKIISELKEPPVEQV
ncbi:MAG: HEAT repeat domain-containing protein [bacterium]